MPSKVNVWVGTIATRQVFDEYVEETYGDSDSPINHFAADQSETFYDHDFVEAVFLNEPEAIENAVAKTSYGLSFAALASAIALERGIQVTNCVFADYDDQFATPKSVQRDGVLLQFLGQFAYEATPYVIPEPKIGDPIYLKPTEATSILPESIAVSPSRRFVFGKGTSDRAEDLLDLSSLVPNISPRQAEIVYVPDRERWELRDLASNGLTMYRKEPLDGDFECPFNGIRFSIGNIEFDWSVEP